MSAQLVGSNALFLHIPKTGGTWVEQALIQTGVQTAAPPTIQGVTYRHCLLSMLEKRHPFVFTFVRHPLSWYESWWKFQAGIWTVWEPGVWHPQRSLEECREEVRAILPRLGGPATFSTAPRRMGLIPKSGDAAGDLS